MEEYIIGYIDIETTVRDEYALDFWFSSTEFPFSKHSNEFYFKFLLKSKANEIIECLLSKRSVESYLQKEIGNSTRFFDEIAGSKLLLAIEDPLSGEELERFLKAEELFNVTLEKSKYRKIKSFLLDSSSKDPSALKLYNRIKQKNTFKFTESKGNLNYGGEGYDIDSAFDGQPDAYWNID